MEKKQKQSQETTEKENDILSSMNRIISASKFEKKVDRGRTETYYKFNDAFVESVVTDASFLSEQYHITPKQAVLFTLILSIDKGDDVRLSALFDSTELNFIDSMTVKADLRALEEAMLIKNKTSDRYSIPQEVNDNLAKNKPYLKPDSSNLSTATILSRMSRYFKNLDMNEGNSVLYMHQIDEMILVFCNI